MEKKSAPAPGRRKRRTPDRAAGTPAELHAGTSGEAPALHAGTTGEAHSTSGRPRDATGGEAEFAGAEPVVIAERVTIVSETPLDAAGEPIDAEQRYLLISERAYVLAAERGFEPGGELEDWLRAEREVDARLGQRNASDGGTSEV